MDITHQRMFVTPAEFPSPDCRGFLLKLDATSKSWKRRYCILVDSSLILYTDFDARSASGKICYILDYVECWTCQKIFIIIVT